MKRIYLLAFLFMIFNGSSFAQRGEGLVQSNVSEISTDVSITPFDPVDVNAAYLIRAMLGDGVPFTIMNTIIHTGIDQDGEPVASAGLFKKGSDDIGIGIGRGIILSSGYVHNAFTPNIPPGFLIQPGDADLDLIQPVLTRDATVIEFKFTAQNTLFSFDYVFGSMENPSIFNWYNDIFAFFLNGVNIALLPGTGDPVAVRSFGDIANSGVFLPGRYSEVDYPFAGWHTSVLRVKAPLVVGQTYTSKMAIADGTDDWSNSYVMIQTAPVIPLSNRGIYIGLALISIFLVVIFRKLF